MCQSRERTIDWENASNWSGRSELPIEYKFKPQDEQDDEDGEDQTYHYHAEDDDLVDAELSS